jgi:hypothetical protein
MNNLKDIGVKIELDKPRTLRYDFNAMIDIDEKYEGIENALAELGADEPGRVGRALKATRYLIYIGLKHEDSDLTEEKVGHLLAYSMGAMTEISASIMRAMGTALPDPEEGAEGKNE